MSELKNKRILVVGGAGFVGSNLTKMILNQHEPSKVIVVDNLLSSERFNLPDDSDNFEFIEGSITNDSILDSFETLRF